MMKKIYLLVLSIAILCASCMDNFLDTQSPSVPSNDNLFESTALAKAALMGVYATMTETYMYGQKLCVNWRVFRMLRSDHMPLKHLNIELLIAIMPPKIFMITVTIQQQSGRHYIILSNRPLL